MTKIETGIELAFMASLWPSFTVDEGRITAWHEVLADQPREIVHAAIVALGRSSETAFAPSTSQLMRAARRLTVSEEANGAEAWMEIMKGSRGKPSARAKRAWDFIGGDLAYRMCEETKVHYLQKRFLDAFESMRASEITAELEGEHVRNLITKLNVQVKAIPAPPKRTAQNYQPKNEMERL